jgi:hypothetical protein
LVCTAVLTTQASRGNAQPATDDPGGIPPGYERIESEDLTLTMRDDSFTTITVDPVDPMIAYVGTRDGRIYKTTDRGQTWTEATAVNEYRKLWQFPGSNIHFGAIRNEGNSAIEVDIDWKKWFFRPYPPESLSLKGASRGYLLMNYFPSLFQPYFPDQWHQVGRDPLQQMTLISAGSDEGFLGVGLSARAPRLSLLVGSRGRPVPVLNRQRLLLERSLKNTNITRITVDPNNHDRLFAATENGLYKSYNGGVSWERSFSGMRPAEKNVQRVAIRPGTPKMAILGTASGAYSSTDDGESWVKITTIWDTGINDVAFDPHDNNIIYIATQIGVLRTNDGGRTYIPIYYSTFPQENDIQAVVIDPFDDDTVYIGTLRGAFVTHKARTGSYNDWTALEGVESILGVTRFAACPRHKGHIYALTRLNDLKNINYGAANPESGIWESWDGGHVWRPIFTGQNDGNAENFALDIKDPDVVWVAWWTAIHRLSRGGSVNTEAGASTVAGEPVGPPMSEMIHVALRYQGIELDEYSQKLQLARDRALLPRKFVVSAGYDYFTYGGKIDDNQFAPNRYLWAGNYPEWHIIAFATWALPGHIYSQDAVPLVRYRVPWMNDELRKRMFEMIQRNYGELERLHATLASVPLDLKTRAIYRIRIEQLEAVVDLATGNYLSRWKKKHRRHP